MATPAPATFAQLLTQAVNEPGILSSAYRQFYGYSLGNQLLALAQCMARGIQPGPIATLEGVGAVRSTGRESDHPLPTHHREAPHDHDG